MEQMVEDTTALLELANHLQEQIKNVCAKKDEVEILEASLTSFVKKNFVSASYAE